MITNEDWTSLLTSIFEYNQCTPFLGAGACIPFFPSGQQLAEKWAAEAAYPFHHKDLSEVAQFIAVNSGGKAAKFKMDSERVSPSQSAPRFQLFYVSPRRTSGPASEDLFDDELR